MAKKGAKVQELNTYSVLDVEMQPETALSVVEDTYTPDVINEIMHYGAFNYNSRECFMLLNLKDWGHFAEIFSNPRSQFNYYYELGRIQFRRNVDIKLKELAEDGDIPSIRELEKRRNSA